MPEASASASVAWGMVTGSSLSCGMSFCFGILAWRLFALTHVSARLDVALTFHKMVGVRMQRVYQLKCAHE